MAILEPTQEQLDARIRDAGGIDPTININDLNDDTPDLSDFPETPEPSFFTTPEIEMPDIFTEKSGERDVLQEKIMSLEEEISGKGEFQEAERERLGIEQKNVDLQSAINVFKRVKAGGVALEEDIQKRATGRGITVGGLAPHTRAQKRDQFIKETRAAANVDVLKGEFDSARILLEDSVNAEFEDEELELETRKNQIAHLEKFLQPFEEGRTLTEKRIFDRMTTLEKRQFDEQLREAKAKIEVEEDRIKEQKEFKTEIVKMGLLAGKAGFRDVQRTINELGNKEVVTFEDWVEATRLVAPTQVKREKVDDTTGISGLGDFTGSPSQITSQMRAQKIPDEDIFAFLQEKGFSVSVINAALGDEHEEEFLDEAFIRSMFTEDELKQSAKSKGFTAGGGFLGFGVGEEGIQDFVDSLVKRTEQKRRGGQTDQKIYLDILAKIDKL